MNQIKSFKIKNPYRPDQQITQEVSISDDLVYDYSNTPWVAVDTEYLSFNPKLDKLCVIQVASKETAESENLKVEILYVYDMKKPGEKLLEVMANENIEKIFHVFSSDMPRIEEFIGTGIKGKIFDTKVAAKIAWTNSKDHGMTKLVKMFADPNFEQVDNEKGGLNDWEVGPDNWTNEQVYYMAQDVVYLDVLRERILTMAERRGLKDLVLETMNVLPTISTLYSRGLDEKVLGY
jgi:ribonuclease D